MNVSQNVRLKQLQQNASHLELLYLHKKKKDDETKECMEFRTGELLHMQTRLDTGTIDQARHSAVGEFLGVVAHKWRQPLNTIALIIHNMVDAWKYGEMNDELIDRSESRAMEQINLLTRSIDNFRSFLDPENTTEYFYPAESIKSVAAQLSGWVSGSSSIEVRVTDESGDALQAAGCQHAFERVMVNLICNANDAIEERQRVSNTKVEGIISVSLTRVDNKIVIMVADNGGGIDESKSSHIFKPYFTTKQKNGGFGMGLYLSKLIIENSMNGNLWFKSIPDGTRFSIMLPAISGEWMRE